MVISIAYTVILWIMAGGSARICPRFDPDYIPSSGQALVYLVTAASTALIFGLVLPWAYGEFFPIVEGPMFRVAQVTGWIAGFLLGWNMRIYILKLIGVLMVVFVLVWIFKFIFLI